jgi:hypothetical protein
MALANQGGALRLVGGALGTGQACCCAIGGRCCQPNGDCMPAGVITQEQCEQCRPPGWLSGCFEIATFICTDPETGLETYPDCPPGYTRTPGQPGRCGKFINQTERDESPCSCMPGGDAEERLLGLAALSAFPCFSPVGYITDCNSSQVNDRCGKWVYDCEDCSRAPCYQSFGDNQESGEWPCRDESPCSEGCECVDGKCVPICGGACDGETPCPEGCECVEGTCQNPLP